MRHPLLILLSLVLALLAPAARAHEMSMAEMEVREISPGEFLWHWSAASDKRPMSDGELRPVWPKACAVAPGVLRCKSDGLKGTLSMEGVGERYSAAMVKVLWLDGQRRVYTLTSAQPSVELYGSADDRRGRG